MEDVSLLKIYSNFSNLTKFEPFARYVSAWAQSLSSLFNQAASKTNIIGDVAYCIAKGSATSVPTATSTTVIFTTVDVDTHNAYDRPNGIYTVPFDGMAYVSACANLEAPSLSWTDKEIFRLCVNYAAQDLRYNSWLATTANADGDPSLNIVTMFPVTKGQPIKICAYQNSGNTCAMQATDSSLYNYVQIAIDQRV